MALLQIGNRQQHPPTPSVLSFGFRIFFIAAAVYAITAMASWAAVFHWHLPLHNNSITTFQWHAHEMIYGYCMAVIAGFLLTAVANWTGIQTIQFGRLLVLFILWIIPRILFLIGAPSLPIAALCDLSFMLYLSIAVIGPIIRARQWIQLGIIAKLTLLTVGNALFYLGSFGIIASGISLGVHGGFYLIISLILTVGGRVMPGYIENGLDEKTVIHTPRWIMPINMIGFLLFFINELFIQNMRWSIGLSIMLGIINLIRLTYWYRSGIWQKPLLWSLYLSFSFITLGFFLRALEVYGMLYPFIALHAFAVGGIGLATVGMMARVSLGHTGRSIRQPPCSVRVTLLAMLAASIIRIIPSTFDYNHHALWIAISQTLWMISFIGFLIIFFGMLAPRMIKSQKTP